MSRIFQPHIVTDDSALGGTIINGSLYKQSDQYLEKVFGSTGDRTKYTESIIFVHIILVHWMQN